MSLLPDPPAVAAQVFADELGRVCRFAELLAGPGVERGLIGPHEAERLWERHLLNCAVVAPGLAAGTVLDLGSGAGLPGVVLALLRPDCTFTLLDATRRRVEFLDEVIRDLHLTDTTALWGRAERLTHPPVATVVARAVAPLDRLMSWALPLLQVGGELVALKGERAEAEAELFGPQAATVGGRVEGIERYGEGVLEPPTVVIRVRKTGRTPTTATRTK